MSPEQVFSIANSAALLAWLLLALAPRKPWARLLAGRIVPAGLALLYTVVIALTFAGADGGFSSLANVSRLFSQPWLLLAGWVHYLAFDLLIGAWEVRDANRSGVPHLWVVPCLFATFMFGPAGWLLYMGLRALRAPHAATV